MSENTFEAASSTVCAYKLWKCVSGMCLPPTHRWLSLQEKHTQRHRMEQDVSDIFTAAAAFVVVRASVSV